MRLEIAEASTGEGLAEAPGSPRNFIDEQRVIVLNRRVGDGVVNPQNTKPLCEAENFAICCTANRFPYIHGDSRVVQGVIGLLELKFLLESLLPRNAIVGQPSMKNGG